MITPTNNFRIKQTAKKRFVIERQFIKRATIIPIFKVYDTKVWEEVDIDGNIRRKPNPRRLYPIDGQVFVKFKKLKHAKSQIKAIKTVDKETEYPIYHYPGRPKDLKGRVPKMENPPKPPPTRRVYPK